MRRTYNNDNRIGGLQALGSLSNINPRSGTAVPLSTSYLPNPMSTPPSSITQMPPPLPPRNSMATPYNRLTSGMGNYYSPYSRYSSGMHSAMYGGGYRMSPYGSPYGAPHDSFNSFVQMAEESTRPAFESIESVVEVFSSISMMLESTYHAVHSSYSAILGVVDQFARLKDHLAQMLSILALLRGLRWLCLKVLYTLRLRKGNPSDEAVWQSARLEAGSSLVPSNSPDKASSSAWPFLMFLGLVIGAPWLMFKLLSKSIAKKKPLDQRMFKDENGRQFVVTTAYDFQASQHGELSFKAGEKLFVAPTSYQRNPKGWLYACNSKQETGLIPSTYLLQARRVNTQSPNSTRNATVAVAGESITLPEGGVVIPTENIAIPNPVQDSFPSGIAPQATNDASAVIAQKVEPEAQHSVTSLDSKEKD